MMSRKAYDAARADNRGYRLAGSLGFAAGASNQSYHPFPSKSLSIMPYYFGKDKGFFAAEQIEPQLVMMAPPTAIAAMVAGELDFSSTTGAATSAIMRGLPIRRVFYVQQDPVQCCWRSPRSSRCRISSAKPSASRH